MRFIYVKRQEALEMFRTQMMIHAFLAPYKKKDALDDGPQLPLFAQIREE